MCGQEDTGITERGKVESRGLFLSVLVSRDQSIIYYVLDIPPIKRMFSFSL